jgi:hypothetical protein
VARAGVRCRGCDPVVRVVTYGRRGIDAFARVVELHELGGDEVRVTITAWAWVEMIDVPVRIM